MKIVVFGGAGFLGSHVCDKLSDAGHEVTVFDRTQSAWIRPDQKMIVGDILDADAVNEAVHGTQAVFNFAGIADIDEAGKRPVDTVRINILGNVIILEACRLAGIKRFVFASSVYVYSAAGGFYRCSKQACETYIENYYQQYGMEYTILRYGSLYGSRADERNGLFSYVRQAMEQGRIEYAGTSDALRDYIHVEDAAQASVEILKPKFINENIVLTGAQSMRVGDLFKMLGEILNKQLEIKYENNYSNLHYEVTPYSFSPRMGKKLVMNTQVDLGQGVLKLIEEFHQKSHPELHNEKGYLVKDS